MSENKNDTNLEQPDTIVAPATSREPGAIAIVRVSGASAASVLASCFTPRGRLAPLARPRRLIHGMAVSASGEEIDDCLAVWMPAPNSFTGEDVAEIHCHGGPAITDAVMSAAMEAGARPAQPGEFTRRAFLNGKMDLAQAEAVADLVVARTDLARRLALRQLRGGLSRRIEAIRETVIDVGAEIEAALDFPEEDIISESSDRLAAHLRQAHQDLQAMLDGFNKARLVREGARVVLAGKPNAGKSSLFNTLVGQERAIVTPHPGTTRDTIESTVDLDGLPVTYIDTAGVRDARDEIEQLGILRTNEAMESADLVLHVVDSTQEPHDSPASMALTAGLPADRILTVWNKVDLTPPAASTVLNEDFAISAKTGSGISALEAAIRNSLIGTAQAEDLALAGERHAECVREATEALLRGETALHDDLGGEFVMIDIRTAILNLGEILGIQTGEEVLDRVFSRFCLGK